MTSAIIVNDYTFDPSWDMSTVATNAIAFNNYFANLVKPYIGNYRYISRNMIKRIKAAEGAVFTLHCAASKKVTTSVKVTIEFKAPDGTVIIESSQDYADTAELDGDIAFINDKIQSYA